MKNRSIDTYAIQGKQLSKHAIKTELKKILNTQSSTPEIQGNDLEFVLEAFKTARYYQEKTKGQSIVKVIRKKAEKYGTFCFYIYREDGTSTDFSYTKMYNENQEIEDVFTSLRHAIDPIISNFRKEFKPFEYEGEWIKDISQVDVDHYDKTFNELAWEWIRNNGGIEYLTKKVNKTEDGSTITCFIDKNLDESFKTFHNAHTHLRFIPKEINRGKK